MTEIFTAQSFFARYQNKLFLSWIYRKYSESKPLHPCTNHGSLFAGFFSYIHPHQITVFGREEIKYLNNLDTRTSNRTIQQVFALDPCFLIMSDDIDAPSKLIAKAKRYRIPILKSTLPGQILIDKINSDLSDYFAESVTLHGVYMDVLGVGVLLTGPSGVGKSELALGLINCGHRLVADDAVVFSKVSDNKLIGTCPSTLQDFLEVRGLGIINIRAMFGDNAIKDSKRLQLIVKIVAMDNEALQRVDRLKGIHAIQTILNVGIEEVTIPVAPGRNLAVLVEGAVRNQILKLTGYQASAEFIARQQKLLEALPL